MNASSPPQKYRRLLELGRGGMASVYLTSLEGPHGFQKLVVVKEMRPDFAQQEEFRRMFFEEARVAARLNHPNVVQSYEVVEDPPGVYSIVMEFLDGQPLGKLLSKTRQYDMRALDLHVMSQVLAGLHYVHEVTDFRGKPMGLVHRDVSPQNVFVTYDGDVKLLDFGIAKAIDSTVETELGTLKGKIAYMAPEHVVGTPIDRRTDIYATGVLLWEAFAGRRMWKGVPEAQIVARLVAGTIPDVHEANPNVPTEVAELLARALAPKREDRFATAMEFKEAVDAVANALGARGTREQLARRMGETFAVERLQLRQAADDVLSGVKRGVDRTGEYHALASLPTLIDRPSGSSVEPTSSTLGRARAAAFAGGAPPPPAKSSRVLNGVALACAAIAIVAAIGAVTATVSKHPPPPPSAAMPVPSASAEPPPIVAADTATTAPLPAPTDTKPADPKTSQPVVRPDPRRVRPPPPVASSRPRRPGDPTDLGY